MRYFSEKILRLRFALVKEQWPPAIVLLESAALSTTLRMTHYFSWLFNLQYPRKIRKISNICCTNFFLPEAIRFSEGYLPFGE
jgi:hypothetical protein